MDDNIERVKYEMCTKGENWDFINKVSGERGFFITLGDIERGSFGDGGNEEATQIEVVKILKGGGIKVQVWLGDGKKETINLERLHLPEGGIIFAP